MEGEGSSNGGGRARLYKMNGRDQVALRNKRRADQVEIRKNRREEKFDRNRQIPKEDSDEPVPASLSSVVEILHGMQAQLIYEAVNTIFESVSENKWNIEMLAKADVLNKLCEIYCNRPISADLRILISKTLAKVCGHKSTGQYEPDQHCIDSLIYNLSTYSTQEVVLCDSLQGIACFIMRSIAYRNLALDSAIVPELIGLCTPSASSRLQRFIMYITTLICEKLSKYSPDVEEIVPLLHIIEYGIQSSDSMIQTDATSACVYLADWPPIYQCMSDHQLCSMLVANLRNNSGNARPTVQWGISMIIQATSYFTDEMINAGLLEVLKGFVNVNFMAQEVCFLISNICVEGEYNIDRLISSGILQCVARVMETSEYRARREAAFVFCHCCDSSNRDHLQKILNMGILSSFCDMLTVMDTNLVSYEASSAILSL
uniref:IBB domain-containing protein n=1 Tax=Caenorhabditis japonica TaxID=281687 RepID=A0A8R1DLL0_CAEJA